MALEAANAEDAITEKTEKQRAAVTSVQLADGDAEKGGELREAGQL